VLDNDNGKKLFSAPFKSFVTSHSSIHQSSYDFWL